MASSSLPTPSSSSGPMSPRIAVIRVLVGAMADSALEVREAAAAALQDNAKTHAEAVLECCSGSLRVGKRRGGPLGSHHAGVLLVMAHTVKQMEPGSMDESFAQRVTQVALFELTNPKEVDSEWQQAATSLLVAVANHQPDIVLNETFHQMTVGASPVVSVAKVLLELAGAHPLLFVPRIKLVLARIVPTLGSFKDFQRTVLAEAFSCWFEAYSQCQADQPSLLPVLNSDAMSLVHSAYDLFLNSWLKSREPKVRSSVAEALGHMAGVVGRQQLKDSLPKLPNTFLNLFKKEEENQLSIVRGLRLVLEAALLTPSQQLLDSQACEKMLSTLLPSVGHQDLSPVSLQHIKIHLEVLHCFDIVARVYPEQTVAFLLQKLDHKELPCKLGSLHVLRRLIGRLSDALQPKKKAIVEAIRGRLNQEDPVIARAIVQVITALAASGYLDSETAHPFMHYLVQQASLPQADSEEEDNQLRKGLNTSQVSSRQLKATAETSLYLLASTVPDMEAALWPSLLQWLVPYQYTYALSMVCKSSAVLLSRRLARGEPPVDETFRGQDVPRPQEVLARLLVLLHSPYKQSGLGVHILNFLFLLAPYCEPAFADLWEDEVPKLLAYISSKDDPLEQEVWDDMVVKFLDESLNLVRDQQWLAQLSAAFLEQYALYREEPGQKALLHRCLGTALQKLESSRAVRTGIDRMYASADLYNAKDREGLAVGIGLVAACHLDLVLDKLRKVLEHHGRKLRKLFSFFFEPTHTAESENVCAAIALMYGYTAFYAAPTALEGRINKLVGTGVLTDLLDVATAPSKQAVITAINLLGQAVQKAAQQGTPFLLTQRDDLLGHVMMLMAGPAAGAADVALLRTQSLALEACNTLVNVEPKLPAVTRARLLEVVMPFFGLPAEAVEGLEENLYTLLIATLATCGDGRSRGDLLTTLLRQLDRHLSSPANEQRRRAIVAALQLLQCFRQTCEAPRTSTPASSAPGPLFPQRDCLHLGERLMAYLPRCTDSVSEIRFTSAQVVEELVSIAVLLPDEADRRQDADVIFQIRSLKDKVTSEATATQLQALKALTRASVAMLTQHEVFQFLCSTHLGVCKSPPPSALGGVTAVRETISSRRLSLGHAEQAKIVKSLLKSAAETKEKEAQEGLIIALAELGVQGDRRVLFEVLVDEMISREVAVSLIERVVQAVARQENLGAYWLDFLLEEVRGQVASDGEVTGGARRAQAATWALGAVFRMGDQKASAMLSTRYAAVLSAYLVQLATVHGEADSNLTGVRELIASFQAFSVCTGSKDLQQILNTEEEERVAGADWTDLAREAAACTGRTRPDESDEICDLLRPALKKGDECQRAVAAAAIAAFIAGSRDPELLQQLVETLSPHVYDRAPPVRKLCLRGLLQIPEAILPQYSSTLMPIVAALVEDSEEGVALLAVQGIPSLAKATSEATMAPLLLGLCVQLRVLQGRECPSLRAAAFSAFASLARFGHHEAFLEKVHAMLPWLAFHTNDESAPVCTACRESLLQLAPLLQGAALADTATAESLESTDKLRYEGFVRDLTWQLATLFKDHVDLYMTATLQAFESPWPVIQANAAYFGGCLLSQLSDKKPVAEYLPQVIASLVRMAASAADAVVRAKAASALSLLLKDVHSLF